MRAARALLLVALAAVLQACAGAGAAPCGLCKSEKALRKIEHILGSSTKGVAKRGRRGGAEPRVRVEIEGAVDVSRHLRHPATLLALSEASPSYSYSGRSSGRRGGGRRGGRDGADDNEVACEGCGREIVPGGRTLRVVDGRMLCRRCHDDWLWGPPPPPALKGSSSGRSRSLSTRASKSRRREEEEEEEEDCYKCFQKMEHAMAEEACCERSVRRMRRQGAALRARGTLCSRCYNRKAIDALTVVECANCLKIKQRSKLILIPEGCEGWGPLEGRRVCRGCYDEVRSHGMMESSEEEESEESASESMSESESRSLSESASESSASESEGEEEETEEEAKEPIVCAYPACRDPVGADYYYHIPKGCNAGGQDWIGLEGREFCSVCYKNFKRAGTMEERPARGPAGGGKQPEEARREESSGERGRASNKAEVMDKLRSLSLDGGDREGGGDATRKHEAEPEDERARRSYARMSKMEEEA